MNPNMDMDLDSGLPVEPNIDIDLDMDLDSGSLMDPNVESDLDMTWHDMDVTAAA